jgi:hypothetical protein
MDVGCSQWGFSASTMTPTLQHHTGSAIPHFSSNSPPPAHVIRHKRNGYSVLLAVCSAICPASFGHVLPICMWQNILVNEWFFFMPFILFFLRIVEIIHSITNEWAKFDTKDMFFFYFFSHASPTSTA